MQIVLSALGDLQDFYNIPVELLDDESKKLYQHCKNFKDEYGKFPAIQTLLEDGFNVKEPPEQFAYYFRQLVKQSILGEAERLITGFSEAVALNDADLFYKKVEEIYNKCTNIKAVGVEHRPYVAGSENYFLDLEREALSPAAVSTGIEAIDKATSGGFRRSEIYTIAGAEKSGKTSVLTFMATQARAEGKRVLFLSCERDKSSVNRLVLSILSNTPPEILERVNPPLTEEQKRRVISANKILKPEEENGFTIIHPREQATPSWLIPYLVKRKPEILFIDSIYMMSSDGKSNSKYTNPTEEVKQLIQQLKVISLTFDIPIVVSTQLNREFALSDAGKWADKIYGSAVYAQYSAFCLCLAKDKAAPDMIIASLEKTRYTSGEPLEPFKIIHSPLESQQRFNFKYGGKYEIPTKSKTASFKPFQ